MKVLSNQVGSILAKYIITPHLLGFERERLITIPSCVKFFIITHIDITPHDREKHNNTFLKIHKIMKTEFIDINKRPNGKYKKKYIEAYGGREKFEKFHDEKNYSPCYLNPIPKYYNNFIYDYIVRCILYGVMSHNIKLKILTPNSEEDAIEEIKLHINDDKHIHNIINNLIDDVTKFCYNGEYFFNQFIDEMINYLRYLYIGRGKIKLLFDKTCSNYDAKYFDKKVLF